MGIVKRAIAKDASVVSMAIDATDIVARIEEIHGTSAVATAALGRLAVATSLMGYTLKNDGDSVTCRIDADGALGQLVAVSDSSGNVKAYVQNPIVEISLNENGKLDVGGAVGEGTLTVIKDMGLKEPYVGVCPLVSGEVAEDFAAYYANSEQTPTVCSLGVLVSPDLKVKAAGGFLIHVLPFASEECIDVIERNIADIPPVTEMLNGGMTPAEIALKLLDGLEPNELDEGEVAYKCTCSRERTEQILAGVGRKELGEMISEGKDVEICCHFCGKKYVFTIENIRDVINEN